MDHHRAREILVELDRQLQQVMPTRVTLDLKGVTFMDSSGIAVLLRVYRQSQAWGGVLRVVGVPEQAGKVLRAAGLERLLNFE